MPLEIYIIRFQEKNLNRDSNLGPPDQQIVVNRWQITSQITTPCEWHVFQEEGLSVNWQLNQDSSMVEHQAIDLEIRSSSPGSGSNFSLEI